LKDSEYELLKHRIEQLFDYWRERMGLKWWSLVVHFVRDTGEFRVDGERKPETVACCEADWRYLKASLSFNMLACADLADGELEYVVVHELCHVLVNETRGPDLMAYKGHEERVTTTIAKAFIWTRDMAREEQAEGLVA
jgi:hypothetical protein